jgi:branched-chain amino acid aminotransferase
VGSIALRYGISVFEGVRLYRQEAPGLGLRPWLLDQHLDRLRNSCRLMLLDDTCCDDVPRIIDELVAVNDTQVDSYARIAVSAVDAGGIGDGSEAALTVSVTPSGRKRWLRDGEGLRLTVSSWQRPSSAVFPSAAKNISAYAGPRLALAQAVAAGFDSCLLCTAEGLVSEAPTATVFLAEGTRLVTPRLGDAVLPGISRAWVLATAPRLGLSVAEEAVTPDRIRQADEVFLCGTGIEFGPVREVEGYTPARWPQRPATAQLVAAYFDQVRGTAASNLVTWSVKDGPDGLVTGPDEQADPVGQPGYGRC